MRANSWRYLSRLATVLPGAAFYVISVIRIIGRPRGNNSKNGIHARASSEVPNSPQPPKEARPCVAPAPKLHAQRRSYWDIPARPIGRRPFGDVFAPRWN